MPTRTSPWRRRFVIALIGIILLLVTAGGWWTAKLLGHIRQHQRHLETCREEFNRKTSQEWAALAFECQQYFKGARAESLPPLLASLKPIFYDIRENEVFLDWTGGFDDDDLNLEYAIVDGKGTLWLIDSRNEPREKAVWSELSPPPTSRP